MKGLSEIKRSNARKKPAKRKVKYAESYYVDEDAQNSWNVFRECTVCGDTTLVAWFSDEKEANAYVDEVMRKRKRMVQEVTKP